MDTSNEFHATIWVVLDAWETGDMQEEEEKVQLPLLSLSSVSSSSSSSSPDGEEEEEKFVQCLFLLETLIVLKFLYK